MKRLPIIISQEEYELLLSSSLKVKDIKKTKLKHYWLAILLAGEAGLRISEIVGYNGKNKIPALTKDKVNLKANQIFVQSGKGKKDRIVPVPPRFKEKHLSMLPLKIKRRSFQHFIENLSKKVLGKRISPHTLRHYFGSRCAEQMPLHQVQALMGHSRLDTTGIYLHANPTKSIEDARRIFGG